MNLDDKDFDYLLRRINTLEAKIDDIRNFIMYAIDAQTVAAIRKIEIEKRKMQNEKEEINIRNNK